MDEKRLQEPRDVLHARAAAVEDNAVYPGQPTATGWLITIAGDVAQLHARVEALEPETASDG